MEVYRRLRELEPGDLFEVIGLENGPWELVQTSFSGCEVKMGCRRESFHTHEGKKITFQKPMRQMISSETLVRKVEP